MAKKNYIIWQETEVNGDYNKISFAHACEPDEMAQIKAKLVGKVTVFESSNDLTDPEGTSMVVTNSTDIDTVISKIKGDETQYFGAYQGAVMFDSSMSGKEIGLMFKEFKPFPNRTTEKPQSVRVNLYAAAAETTSV